MESSKIQAMTKISLCTALMCISAYLAVPLPFTTVVLTLQTLVMNLTALVLTPVQSFISMLVYVLIGICGIPVFSGGTAGIGRLLGPTGGFILGFLVVVPLISLLKGKKPRLLRYLGATLIGVPLFYFCGVFMYCILNKTSPMSALPVLVFPFIPGDILKSVLASFLGLALNAALSKIKGSVSA